MGSHVASCCDRQWHDEICSASHTGTETCTSVGTERHPPSTPASAQHNSHSEVAVLPLPSSSSVEVTLCSAAWRRPGIMLIWKIMETKFLPLRVVTSRLTAMRSSICQLGSELTRAWATSFDGRRNLTRQEQRAPLPRRILAFGAIINIVMRWMRTPGREGWYLSYVFLCRFSGDCWLWL